MSFEEKTPRDNEAEFESRVFEVSDEESTVFSAPEAHRDRVKKGVKLKKIIACVLALAIVITGGWAVAEFIKLPEEPTATEEIDPPIFGTFIEELRADNPQITEGEDAESKAAWDRRLIELYFDGIDRVTLTRADAAIEYIYADVEKKTTDDEGNATTKTVTEWRLKEVDPSLTSYSNIDNTVSSYTTQHYTKKVSEDKNDGNDYGFDSPEYQVDFYKEGSDEIFISLIIGGENPTKTGRYATTSKDDAVYYIAGVSEFYHYQKTLTDFAEAESIPAISKDSDYSDNNYTNGQLVMCDKMILKGTTFGGEYVIKSQEADNVQTFTSYMIESPTKRPANDENIGNIVALFSYGIVADGCYSYSVEESELKKYGLDNPDFDVTIYVDNIKRGFAAKLQEDGNYAVYYEGNKTIMKVSAGSVAPASYERGDLFNTLLFIESITNAESLRVESGAAGILFDVETEYDEEADTTSLVGISVAGKTIDKSNFQSYYQFLVSIKAQSYDVHDTKGMSPTTVITLTHTGGKTKTVVKYFQITTARYQVEVNGVPMGLISSSEHTRIMKYANNLINGKEYNAR